MKRVGIKAYNSGHGPEDKNKISQLRCFSWLFEGSCVNVFLPNYDDSCLGPG